MTAAGAGNVQQVKNKKERCVRRLERAEQQLEKLERSIDHLDMMAEASGNETIGRHVETSLNKIEYFKNRLDRTRNQVDKIEDDLAAQDDAAPCKDCIRSSVNLMCRQAESIYSELAEYSAKTGEFELQARRSANAGQVLSRAEKKIARCKATADPRTIKGAERMLGEAQEALDRNKPAAAIDMALGAIEKLQTICDDNAGEKERVESMIARAKKLVGRSGSAQAQSLLNQGISHFTKGKELQKANDKKGAETEFIIARKFLEKAADLAGNSQ
ncbi:MAG: hypothetical protein GF401_10055 [Chitinivibrionales bacterium]|nr:hypothetical protein [Chitinivibrionales bacterium]